MPLFRIEVLRSSPVAPFYFPVTPEERRWLNLDWCHGMIIEVSGSPEAALTRVSLGIPPRRYFPGVLGARYMEGAATANTLHPALLYLSRRVRE